MNTRANLARSKSEFTRSYENPRGVDFSEIRRSGNRFAYLENMYVDYDGGADAVESIPGFRKILGYGERINAIHLQDIGENDKYLVIHAGTKLFRFNVNDRDELIGQPPIATIADNSSHAFQINDRLYVMDGKSLLQIDKNGTAHLISEDGDSPPYIPTTYENGAKKEERNLLIDKCLQKFHLTDMSKFAYYTKGLTFAVNDSKNRYCSLTGCPTYINGDLFIPATAIIEGVEYKVTEVAPSAFLNQEGITAIYGGENLEYIGKYAFKNCMGLEYAIFHNSLRFIDYSAFCTSPFLTELYIGLGFEEFADEAFIDCNIQYINYAGDERSAGKIKGLEQFADATLLPLTTQSDIRFGFPIHGDVDTVYEVLIGNEKKHFSYDKDYNEVTVYVNDRRAIMGSEVTVKCTLAGGELSKSAVLGCTLSTVHDGRVFLSGNPAFPGYVFYSLEKPGGRLFFSEQDYFIDGVNNYPITSLISANGALTVFKSDDDGSGSIFCHSSASSGDKRIYPLTYTHGGIVNKNSSHVISDDTVFLSAEGLCALEKVAGSSYKELRCRSTNINRKLLEERLEDVCMTEWCGYLVLCAGGHYYLADSRSKYKTADSFEYEWYYLNGIGTYSDECRVYRYSPFSDGDCIAKKNSFDKIAEGIVMSVGKSDGTLSYYVEEDGIKYSVYPTEELCGGVFSPSCYALGVGKLLFFGTESGDLCVFNNDKRGVAPEHISIQPDFNEKDYALLMGDRIHPYFYSFNGRRVSYCLKTASDDCDIPHLAKSTVKHSLILKCKSYAESSFNVESVIDHGIPCTLGNYSAGRITFHDVNFEKMSFSTAPYSIIPVPENEKNWVEKQLCFVSDGFRAPFGICSFTYRYKIKGKIKYL